MKTFKQYTKQKEKEPVLIINTHGAHSKSKEKKPVLISNTHGSHSRNNNPYNESEEVEGTWEHYIKQNHNPHLGNNPDQHIEKLQTDHPLDNESHNDLRGYTQDSTPLARHFLKSHEDNKSPEEDYDGWHDIKGLDDSINRHKLKYNTTTFSGIGFNPEKLDSNKAITHLSSSTSPSLAQSFSKEDDSAIPGKTVYHVIKHNLKAGQPAAVIGSQHHFGLGKPISEYHDENEVLLPRTDSTKDKLHLHFNGYKDYPSKDGSVVRVHNSEWRKPE